MTIPRAADPMQTPGAPREIILPDPPPSSEISLVSLVNVLLRNRILILLLALAFGFRAGYNSITSGKTYTTQALFMPKGARGQGQLGGIAAQFGINLPTGDAGQSPQLYTDLLEMRPVLWPIAQRSYRVTTDSGIVSGNLIKLFGIQSPREEVRKERVINSLKGAIRTNIAVKTGVITLNVSTGRPDLSLQIAQNLLDQVNIYNLANRQASAAAERAFVEKQVDEKRSELRRAESELENFLESNRQYRSSPQLTLEYGRLQRQVDMRNQLFTMMAQAYENARIDEMRDLPVITVIEPPELPTGPDPRGGVRKTLIGLLIGLVLGCLIAFARDRLARNRASQSDEFLQFAALKREALGDVTHPWRPLTRVIRSRQRA